MPLSSPAEWTEEAIKERYKLVQSTTTNSITQLPQNSSQPFQQQVQPPLQSPTELPLKSTLGYALCGDLLSIPGGPSICMEGQQCCSLHVNSTHWIGDYQEESETA